MAKNVTKENVSEQIAVINLIHRTPPKSKTSDKNNCEVSTEGRSKPVSNDRSRNPTPNHLKSERSSSLGNPSSDRSRANSVATNKRKRTDQLCGVCVSEFEDNKNTILCNLCERRFHGICADFTDEEIAALALIGSKVSWYCADCSVGAASLHKHAVLFEERLIKLDSAVNNIQSEQCNLKQELTSATSDIAANKSNINANKSNISRNKTRIDSAKEDISKLQATQRANNTMITTLNSRMGSVTDKLRDDINKDLEKMVDEKIKDDVIEAKINKKVEEKLKIHSDTNSTQEKAKVDEIVNKLVVEKFTEMKDKELPNDSSRSSNLDTQVKDMIAEREKIFARRNQLLIMNFKENNSADEDKRQLYELFGLLYLDEEVIIAKTDRLGNKRNDGKPRFLRVEMNNIHMKRKILGNATKLRNVPDKHKFAKVYIKPNLTEKQQEESKNLQAELKKRRDKEPTIPIKISKGKIVVVKSNNN